MTTLRPQQIYRGIDLGVFTITILLILFSLAALFSFSLHTASPDYSFLLKQAMFAAIGVGLVYALVRFDYRTLAGIHWLLYGAALVGLVAVWIFGRTVHGTTGWFVIGWFQVQPVEFVKILLVLFLAKWFNVQPHDGRWWRLIFRSALLIGVPVGLVMLQPDLGSAMVIIAIWLVMIFIQPVPRRMLAVILVAMAVAGSMTWMFALHQYQKDRILTFVSPGSDPLGAGYNVRQAVTAIGSGGWFGRGLGLGPQSQLNFIPERNTDFIFATIGEELGFVGGGVLIGLYGLWFWRLGRVITGVRDSFTVMMVCGLATIFFVHTFVNIGMNMGVVPVTGIPLPFLSYGGSAVVAGFIAIGLIESAVLRERTRPL